MILMSSNNLTLGYGPKIIIENLSFRVEQGDYLCIIGKNGTGKSTLLQACLGLLQPLKGEITLNANIRSGEIGYLPQQNVIQADFPASCKEIIFSGCINRCGWRPFFNKPEKQLVLNNMLSLGILDLADCYYSELSGGQKQKVLLARALCAAKKILFLDEPITGLDTCASQEMYSLIEQLNTRGITIIMVTHDLNIAINRASHVLDLNCKPIFWGTRQEYEVYITNCYKQGEV